MMPNALSAVRTVLGCATSTLALACALQATAAEAVDRRGEAREPEVAELGEIVVTANKRAESAQSVPISITAASGEQLARAGVTDVVNLQRVSPGIVVAPVGSLSSTVVRIRGVGTSGSNSGFESAVGVFIDGVFRPRAGQALGSFVDVERIELMRGPQGTLFGKNTTAGAISIITNEPQFDFGGSALLGIGENDYLRGEVMVTGPITEKLAFRLAGNLTQRDGVHDKLVPNTGATPTRVENYFNDRDRFIVKGQLLFLPNESLSIRLIGDYAELDEAGNVGMPITTPAALSGRFTALGAFRQPDYQLRDRQSQVNQDSREVVTDGGITADIGIDLGGIKLTSISAWRDYESRRSFDLDLVGYDAGGPFSEYQNIELKSQEFQVSGETGSLAWLAGAFLFDEKIQFGSRISLGSQFAQFAGIAPALVPVGSFAGQGFRQAGTQSNKGYSIFTQNTLDLTDKIQLTAGVRYNYSEKRGIAIHNGAPVVAPTTPGIFSANDPFCAVLGSALQSMCFNRSIDVNRSESAWSGTAKIKYDITESANVYASYSRGYKAGGVNLDREAVDDTRGVVTDLATFRPETVDAYEIGLKSQWLDNRLRLNLAGYFMDYRNFQLNSFNGIGFSVINVPAKARGFEAELVAVPVDGLTVNASVARNRSRFSKNLSHIPFTAAFQGKDLPMSPHWQIAAGFNYDKEIQGTGLRLLINGNASLTSDYNGGALGDPSQLVDDYTLIDGAIGLRTLDDRYGAKLSATNLANVTAATIVIPTILQTGGRYAYLTDPRQVTFTIDVKF